MGRAYSRPILRKTQAHAALPAGFDPSKAYLTMVRMRLVEEALVQAWADGLVPGEYHSGIGEEGINAGVLAHLNGGDSMALDHRNTSPLVGRGTDLTALLLEVMGSEEGLNRGRAGHMHLMDPSIPAAADGIVGTSGPLAVGHAVAHQRLNPGRVAIAFHGEAAVNQGMLMEAYNLAVAWKLPVVFVCKDNKWSITTVSQDVTGGDVAKRASSFGLAVERARGDRVEDVHRAAGRLIERARKGHGPGFLHASCHRPAGHFEGDPIVRLLRHPRGQAEEMAPGIIAGVRAETGGSRRERAAAMLVLTKRGVAAVHDYTVRAHVDPVHRIRRMLDKADVERIEALAHEEVEQAVTRARAALGPRPTFGAPGGGYR
jgi:TPP-dependent pyruvate/acetoin dehydrogenase alpha subunit